MLNKLLFKLTSNLPCRIIYIGRTPYLERYSVGRILGVCFYLHRFVDSDGDREVHDHPWRWAGSFILCGGYVEERVCALDLQVGWFKKLMHRRWFNSLGPHIFHQIIEIEPGTWTLFFHGRRFKSWGFLKFDPTAPSITYHQPLDVAANKNWEKSAPIGRLSGREPI